MLDRRWRNGVEQGLGPLGGGLRRLGITADALTVFGLLVLGRDRGPDRVGPLRLGGRRPDRRRRERPARRRDRPRAAARPARAARSSTPSPTASPTRCCSAASPGTSPARSPYDADPRVRGRGVLDAHLLRAGPGRVARPRRPRRADGARRALRAPRRRARVPHPRPDAVADARAHRRHRGAAVRARVPPGRAPARACTRAASAGCSAATRRSRIRAARRRCARGGRPGAMEGRPDAPPSPVGAPQRAALSRARRARAGHRISRTAPARTAAQLVPGVGRHAARAGRSAGRRRRSLPRGSGGWRRAISAASPAATRARPASTRSSTRTAATGSRCFRLPAEVRAGAVAPHFTIEGYEHVEAGLARGQGRDPRAAAPRRVGVGAARGWRAQGHRLLAVVERIEPPELLEWFAEQRAAIGHRGRAARSRRVARRAAGAARQPHRVPALRPRPRAATASRSSSSASARRCPAVRRRSRCARGDAACRSRSTFGPGRGHLGVVRPPIAVERDGAPARRHRADHAGARARVRGADPRRARAVAPAAAELAERPRTGSGRERREGRDDVARTRCRARAACRVRCSGSRASCASSASTCASSGRATVRRPSRGVVSVGPSVEWELERLGRADLARARDRAPHRRGDAQHRARRRAPARADRCPARAVSALIGFNGPMVGTFHAVGRAASTCGLRPALRSLMTRLSVPGRRCRSRRARPRRGNWYGAEYTVLWNGIEVDRIASAVPDADADARPCCSSAATNRARGSRCCSTRGRGIDRDARAVGRRRRAADRRAARAARPATSNGSAPSPTRERNALLRGATVFCARRRCAASRSASCCSRRWPRARRSSRRRSRATERRPRRPRRAARAARRRRRAARRAAAACSTTPALRDRLVAVGPGAGRASSRWRRLAERYLELYDRALVPVADSGSTGRPG